MAAEFYVWLARKSMSRQRLFRDRTCVFDTYTDDQFICDFRFPRSSIDEIIRLCAVMGRQTRRSKAIPIQIQVLAALRFFARGIFQDDGKDVIGISQPSFSRILSAFTDTMLLFVRRYVKFASTDAEVFKTKTSFYKKAGFPNTLGAVDGSHIFILTPSGEEELMYVCQKGGHSINVQFICDADMLITDVVAKWPGATHDSFIWSTCGRREFFSAHPPNGWLIGDSAYPLEPWLLTAYHNPTTREQCRYNRSFKSTRNVVERTIGLFKNVFRAFDGSAGNLIYTPSKVCKMIVVGAILHNMRRKLCLKEDETFEVPGLIDEDVNTPPHASDHTLQVIGEATRVTVTQKFFSDQI